MVSNNKTNKEVTMKTQDETKVAKNVTFNPAIRVVVENANNNEDIITKAIQKIQSWTKQEIIDWVVENFDSIEDAQEPPYEFEK